MSKQPLEGLTVRIFDPPKKDEKGNVIEDKGSRGYRQYTEKIGSSNLEYSTHRWNDKANEPNSTESNKKD